MITPSNKLSCNLLKSKKSKIRQRLKKKRSKKRRPKPMVKKPKKRRSKRMVDQLSSKMENHQWSSSPFPQDMDQLPVTPELSSEVAHLPCSKMNTPNQNVNSEKTLSELLTLPAQADNQRLTRRKDPDPSELPSVSNVKTPHRLLQRNQSPYLLLSPLLVTSPTHALPTWTSSTINQLRFLPSNQLTVLRTVEPPFRCGVRALSSMEMTPVAPSVQNPYQPRSMIKVTLPVLLHHPM